MRVKVWDLAVVDDGDAETTQHRSEGEAWTALLSDAKVKRDLREWLETPLAGEPGDLTDEDKETIIEALADAGVDVKIESYIFDTEGFEVVE